MKLFGHCLFIFRLQTVVLILIKFSEIVVKLVFNCCPQEAHLRNSSSPPNSTGSTADSDGWENQRLGCGLSSPDEPPPKNRKSFAGFKRPASEDFEPQKRPKSAGLLLEGRTKADKVKKKKQQLRKSKDFAPFTPPSAEGEIYNYGCTIKEEPEDYLSIPVPTDGMGSDQPMRTGSSSKPALSSPATATCKEEPDVGRPCWNGSKSSSPKSEDVEKPLKPEEEAVVLKVEGFSGKRIVVRQGKQVVFRDEDGSGDDEDIMVDSGKQNFSVPNIFTAKLSFCPRRVFGRLFLPLNKNNKGNCDFFCTIASLHLAVFLRIARYKVAFAYYKVRVPGVIICEESRNCEKKVRIVR